MGAAGVAVLMVLVTSCPTPVTVEGSATRNYDLDPPAAPTDVSAPPADLYDSSFVTFDWTQNDSGFFRIRLNGGAWTEISGTTWSLGSNRPGGTHQLEVQERDVLGNWSASTTLQATLRVREPYMTWSPLLSGTPDMTPNIADGYDTAPAPTGVILDVVPFFSFYPFHPQGGLTGRYRVILTELGAAGPLVRYDQIVTGGGWSPPEPLEPELYRISVQAESALGAWSLPAVMEFTTLPQTVYVDAAAGDDANVGTAAQPKRTINAALTAHAYVAGVQIAPGVYPEQIELTVPTTLFGSGPETVISGISTTSQDTILINTGAGGSFVENLAVQPPTGTSNVDNTRTAIRVVGASNVDIRNVSIALNPATTAGDELIGIRSDDASSGLRIENSTIIFGQETAHPTRSLIRVEGNATIARNRLHMHLSGTTGTDYAAISLGNATANIYDVYANVIDLSESGAFGSALLTGIHQLDLNAVVTAVHNTFVSQSEGATVAHYRYSGTTADTGSAGITLENNLFVNRGGTPFAFSDGAPGINSFTAGAPTIAANHFSGFTHAEWFEAALNDINFYDVPLLTNTASTVDPALEITNWYRPTAASPLAIREGGNTTWLVTVQGDLDIAWTLRSDPVSVGAWEF